RPRDGTITQAQALCDLLMQPADEAVGNGGGVAAGAERVAPLVIVELRQELARPYDIVGRDRFQQLLVPAAVVEPHEPVLHTDDESLAREDVGIAALRRQTTGLAECGAEIADHVPMLHDDASLADLVKRVVRVLEIGAVEQYQDHEQPLVRPHADERILLPRPFADMLEIVVGEAKTAAGLDVRPSLAIVDRERRQE